MSFPTPVPQVAQHNKKDGKPSCFPNFLECFRSSKDSFGNPGQDKKTELMSGPTLGEIPDPSTTLFTAPPSASQSLLPHPPISQAPSESSDNSGATSTTATPPDYTVGKSDGKSLGGSATFASSSVQSPGSPTIVTTTGVIASQSSFASGAIVTQASQSPSFTPEGSFSSTELSPSSPTATPAVSGAIRRVNAGAIAGGVLGALVFLIILVAVIMITLRLILLALRMQHLTVRRTHQYLI
ncbi:hypothetical protein H0H92_012273 [Tricholoma furcatifolium]|nr:hypothetical protein H0H92_012273 [Tricholoma furcatifolium]